MYGEFRVLLLDIFIKVVIIQSDPILKSQLELRPLTKVLNLITYHKITAGNLMDLMLILTTYFVNMSGKYVDS